MVFSTARGVSFKRWSGISVLVAVSFWLALSGYGLPSQPSGQTDAPPEVLTQLIGEWSGPDGAVMRAVPVAGGRGVHSTYRSSDGSYEAVALWAYDAPTNMVRMLEVNTMGAVMLHVGEVNSAESLALSCYSNADPAELVKHVTITWDGDALKSTVVFYKNKEPGPPRHLEFTRVGS